MVIKIINIKQYLTNTLMKISLAIAALLNIITVKQGAQSINIMSVQQASTLSEETRYI